jgi:phospholipid/cholesterol/gamma-HCH transport system permease protein
MESGVQSIGRAGINIVSRLGGIGVLFLRFLLSLKDIPRSFGLIVSQLYFVGVRSLPLIVVVSIFVGAVATWQAAYQFKFLGHAVGKAVVMELAPVLSALVYAGRVGAGIAAELGTMKVTEQIDALESMGISPVRYLVMPRVVACSFMVPMLVVFANFVAIMGGLVVSITGVDISSETFLNGFRDSFQVSDFMAGMTKAFVFGVLIGVVGCYEGMQAQQGAEGVGHATTNSVVISSVGILVLNFAFAVLLFRL